MKACQIQETVSFYQLCQILRKDKESLIQTLIDRKIDCYRPKPSEDDIYIPVEVLKESDIEKIRFDMQDVNYLALIETVEEKSKNNLKASISEIKTLVPPPRVPNVEEWLKTVKTVVRIIEYYLLGHEWPAKKNHKDEWKGLLLEWNKEGGENEYRLHDNAREMLWNTAKNIKAVTNKTYIKPKPQTKKP